MADDKVLDMGTAKGALPSPSGRAEDVLDDPEMEGLTLYEKKALLVNRELDGHGMGEENCMLLVSCRTQYLVGRMAVNLERLIQCVLCADSASIEQASTKYCNVQICQEIA